MKKLLALVLALVMTLGLATVSTSAAYTDANDIDYSEAVDVMTAVGVFQGKGNAFAPKDGLNRAEAAKLIAYLMLGNKTAESMKGSGTRFTDIPASHWAAGYIEYLASVGVVSGVGGGQFNPNGQVTAVQFAKMLLVALGYDAELENFVGEGWSINIQKVANENDLFKGLDISANDALTREQAAQMCLNDLKADMVEYSDKGTTVKIGESTVVTGAKKADKKTTSNDKGKAIDDDMDGAAYILNLGEDLYNGDLKLTGGGHDDMGRPANEWKYKTVSVGTYAASGDLIFEKKDGVKRTELYQAIGKTASDDLLDNTTNGTTANDKASFVVYSDGVEVTKTFDAANGGAKYLVDKNNSNNIGMTTDEAKNGTGWTTNSQYTGNGATTQVYLTEGDSTTADLYTIVIVNEYLVQATADYSNSREELNVAWKTTYPQAWTTAAKTAFQNASKNTIKQEDFDVSGVKKDDFLVVTYSAEKDSFQTVKAATTLEGEVTKYVYDDTVTIDGTTYKYAKKVVSAEKKTSYTVGNKVVMITDGTYILRVDDANATKDFVYLQDMGTNAGLKTNVKVALYGTDGKLRTVDMKKLTGFDGYEYTSNELTTLAAATAKVNSKDEADLYGWYTYSVDDAGVYTLKAIRSADPVKNTVYTYGLKTYANTVDGVKIVDGDQVNFLKDAANADVGVKGNSKTVVIVLDRDEDITVYNGLTNVPTITLNKDSKAGAAYVSYVQDSSNFVTYAFVDLSDTTAKSAVIDDSTQSNDYLMVIKSGDDTYETKDNNNVYRPDTVVFEGAVTTKNFDKEQSAKLGVLYHKIKTDSKGYITGLTSISGENNKTDYVWGESIVSSVSGNKITFEDGTVTIGNKGYLLNTDNCVNLILGKGSAPAKDKKADYTEYLGISGSALESYLDGHKYTYNFYGVRHDDNSSTLDALYVWVAGDVATVDDLREIKDSGSFLIDNYGKAAAKVTDAVTAPATLTIKSDVYITGDLTVDSNLTIDGGTVNVDGNVAKSAGTETIKLTNGGKLYIKGNLDAGALTITGCELEVDGTATFAGAVDIKSSSAADPATVTFKKAATFKNTVKLGKNSDITVTAKATFEKGATIENGAEVEFKGAVDAVNTSSVKQNITITGSNVTFDGAVTAATVSADAESALEINNTVTATTEFAEGTEVSGTKAEAAKALTAAKKDALAKITALATLKDNEYDVVKTDLTSLKAAADKAVNDATTVEAVAKVMAKDKDTDAYTGEAMKALQEAVKAYEDAVALKKAVADAKAAVAAEAKKHADFKDKTGNSTILAGMVATAETAITEAAAGENKTPADVKTVEEAKVAEIKTLGDQFDALVAAGDSLKNGAAYTITDGVAIDTGANKEIISADTMKGFAKSAVEAAIDNAKISVTVKKTFEQVDAAGWTNGASKQFAAVSVTLSIKTLDEDTNGTYTNVKVNKNVLVDLTLNVPTN